MFKKLVSNLPYSPSLLPQVSFYIRRLHQENLARLLGLLCAGITILAQIAFTVASPIPSIASDPNDLVSGGLYGNRGQELSEEDAKDKLHASLYSQDAIPGLQELFRVFGVSEADIAASEAVYICSQTEKALQLNCAEQTERALQVIGRERSSSHPTQSVPFQTVASPEVYYHYPLDAQSSNSASDRYKALSIDDGRIYVLYAGGHIVFSELPEEVIPVAEAAPIIPYQHIYQSKSARIVTGLNPVTVNANDPRSVNADQSTAEAGDLIEYRLIIENTGATEYADYAIPSDYIQDILHYADVIDRTGQRVTTSERSDQPIELLGGGLIEGTTVTWNPIDTLRPHQREERLFYVQVKNPIPATNHITSNPQRYDCEIVNSYGNTVTIFIACPLEKQVEQSINSLPGAGPIKTMSVLIGLGGLGLYFYKRNQLLRTELTFIKREYTGENI